MGDPQGPGGQARNEGCQYLASGLGGQWEHGVGGCQGFACCGLVERQARQWSGGRTLKWVQAVGHLAMRLRGAVPGH